MRDHLTGYQIFDSMDQPCSRIKGRADLLYDQLDKLQKEAEDDAWPITYAIGKILPDGSVTFDI
jgi:hypothetical protein